MAEYLPGSFAYIGPVDLFLRLACALIAGVVLGIDREVRHRRVGVRTYMLVSLGAAGFGIVTMELAAVMETRDLAADPTRVAQGLVGALGFLGAGAIIQGQGHIGGMATAASIWVAGAVGMASGLGYFTHALAIAAIAGSVLAVSRLLPHRGAEDRPEAERKERYENRD